ncbi:YeiH family protein [Pseudoclavibacter sp. 13-3]|uniref:YeiH family protein n=1 Tax=Pseudoclavibacter sp. 13-3 TaxID=2901228 RepID=UPI001E375851|nr:putative sulfate exporter family transporter [Pseudoclavibacter sp. 13-3]
MPQSGHHGIVNQVTNAQERSSSQPHAQKNSLTARGRRRLAALWPGLLLCAVGTAVAFGVVRLLPGMSPMLTAIILGVLVRNVFRLQSRLEPGIAYAAKRILRIGVVLLGLQLMLGDILALGPGLILVVVCVVTVGILTTVAVGRWMGMKRTQVLLIGGGFSICGAAAVAAVDGVLDDDDEEEVVTAVALVVIFGTLMIPLVPLVAGTIGLSDHQTGLWAGASVHEVAQVVAVGGTVSSTALAAAVIVKLARVLMLAPVLTVVGLWRRVGTRRAAATGLAASDESPTGRGIRQTHRPPIMPLFVAGFIAMVAIRSLGIVPPAVVAAASVAQSVLLAAAMFALGAGVKISMFRRIGPKPFILAVIATLVVGGIGLGGVLLFG